MHESLSRVKHRINLSSCYLAEFNIDPPVWVRKANQRLVRERVSHSTVPSPQRQPFQSPSSPRSSPSFTMSDEHVRKMDELADTVANLAKMVENLATNSSSAAIAKNMEKMFKRHLDGATYYENTENEISPAAKLPDKFSANDLPQFKPTDDPRFHLKALKATLSLKGVDSAFYPKVFPLSLAPVCQKWFFSLSEKETETWEDVALAFMTRYKGNIQSQTSSRELEILKQGEKEGFTAFLSRWKEAAAQLVHAPPEIEMVKVFISNLQPRYKNHLRYLGLDTFNKSSSMAIPMW